MNQNNDTGVVSKLSAEQVVKQPHPVNQITSVSKILSAVLFIILPFVGAYVGYQFAPEKVVEVEKVVMVQPEVITDDQTVAEVAVQEIVKASTTNLEKFTHPSDGYSFMYDATVFEPETMSTSEFAPSTGFLPSAQVTSQGGYIQVVDIHIYNGNVTAAQNTYIKAYDENFDSQILKTENLIIDSIPMRAMTLSTDSGSSSWTVYFIGVSNSQTIVASGDTTITSTIRTK